MATLLHLRLGRLETTLRFDRRADAYLFATGIEDWTTSRTRPQRRTRRHGPIDGPAKHS